MTITGGCRCGAVRYKIDADRIMLGNFADASDSRTPRGSCSPITTPTFTASDNLDLSAPSCGVDPNSSGDEKQSPPPQQS